MDVVEDYRLIVVATRSGWRTFVILDDGVELLERVEVGPPFLSHPPRTM